MSIKFTLFLIIAAISVSGCTENIKLQEETSITTSTIIPTQTVAQTLTATPNPVSEENFILYVSSQSFTIDPVDIKIMIDGKVVVNKDFYVGNQHNWQKFQFSLSSGNHKIYVESVKGDAKLEKEFEITNKHWAEIDYWYNPESSQEQKEFAFNIRDEPIYFV